MDGVRHYLKLITSGYLRPCLQQTRREKQSWTSAGDPYVNNIALYVNSYLFIYLFISIISMELNNYGVILETDDTGITTKN